ncbi:MAG: pyruvate formate lyase family protein [Kiritimatiellia bacterium]|jgi:pyruvate-formate lyase
MISPRIQFLRQRLEGRMRILGAGDWSRARFLCDPAEQQAYLALLPEAHRQTASESSLRFRARLLRLFAGRMPVEADPDSPIQGSMRFTGGSPWSLPAEDQAFIAVRGPWTQLHVAVDYPRMVREGPAALRARVQAMPPGELREALLETVDAFRHFIRRHEGCADLADRPARTLLEALQVVWFTHIFLHAEGGGWWGVSFGRLDDDLLPFLSEDAAADAEAVGAFLLKCCEGEESQNLTLGGARDDRLTLLFLDTMRALKLPQPSLSLRIDSRTSQPVWDAALALAMEGFGMPAFFHSDVVREGLRRLGVPYETTADWAVVGCYEATLPGATEALTTAGQAALPRSLVDFLGLGGDFATFDAFLSAYRDFFRHHYESELLPRFNRLKASIREQGQVPFETLCLRSCIERNRASTDMGADFNFFGVNFLGIGTLVDSLVAVRELVFVRKTLTLAGLAEQVAADFPDEAIRAECRACRGKFGTGSPESDALASELSAFFADEVLRHPLDDGSRPYPAFFWFGGDIHHPAFATPDGRHAADRFSYGCGPDESVAGAPTEWLNAAARIAHDHAPCGAPLTVSMNRGDASPEKLRWLVESYFAQGGSHLHVNLASADELRAAQRDPDAHASLLVRISGYSARFVSLDREWQDALIARTELGR